ncbi:hypothetical protein AYI69_g10548 [Smittium culicis]|uniref:Uncharacterized protein n=1 Tax=Smittium culicis TaxID=133412 RepID=A0A1R1X4Z3_9FUNG|nr:hypothetical protein AYI69_g10548 [Smittium culicis]
MFKLQLSFFISLLVNIFLTSAFNNSIRDDPTCSFSPPPKHYFQFFADSYYKNRVTEVQPFPYQCYYVGKFSSAIFSEPLIGYVRIFEGCDCSGNFETRDMLTGYAPGDNLKDYQSIFSSFIYIPDKVN